MAPNASDPKDLQMVLNPARCRALSKLIDEIISFMRSKIEQSFETTKQSQPQTLSSPILPERHVPTQNNTSSSQADLEAEARQRRLETRLEERYSNPKMRQLKRDTLFHFDGWMREVRAVLRTICDGPEDVRREQRRKEWLATRNEKPPPYTPSPFDPITSPPEIPEKEEDVDFKHLQELYFPIPTRLTTISKDDRICTLSCMILILLSLGHYSAYSRTLLCYLTSSFELPLSVLTTEETEIAQTLMLASKTLTADAETQKRQAENASSRRWKIGLASVAGAAVIGITGGLAAPVVAGAIGGLMGGVGLGGVASFLGIFFMNGALVGSLFGAYGATMTGELVSNYAKDVSDFRFIPLASEWGSHSTSPSASSSTSSPPSSELLNRRLRITIGVNGWLQAPDDVTKPWRVLGRETEVFALRYEMDALLSLGGSMQNMVTSYAWSYVKLEILKRTVLATLWYALWPLAILKMATSIDNPFSVAKIRSEKAGEVLADALINKAQGERPVTLIGYSLGARVIYSCLKSLAERKAFGLIESVVLIGAPVPSDANNWKVMRSVVSGRIVNVYSEHDYLLAFLYRATSIQLGVAGIQAITGVEGIKNLDLSKEVSGHLRYPDLIGQILKRAGFEGILVRTSEIEGDVSDIQLLDVDKKVELYGDDAMEMMDTSPAAAAVGRIAPAIEPKSQSAAFSKQQRSPALSSPGTGPKVQTPNAIDELTRTLAGLDMQHNPTQPTTTLLNPTEERLRRGVLDITDGLACTQLADLPPEEDSDDDDNKGNRGIIMIDDESDDEVVELREVESVPIDDDAASSSLAGNQGLGGIGAAHNTDVVIEDERDKQKVIGFFGEQTGLTGLGKGR